MDHFMQNDHFLEYFMLSLNDICANWLASKFFVYYIIQAISNDKLSTNFGISVIKKSKYNYSKKRGRYFEYKIANQEKPILVRYTASNKQP